MNNDSAHESAETEQTSNKGPNATTRMVGLVRKHAELVHDGKQGYATFRSGDRRECWPLASQGFRSWMLELMDREGGGGVPSGEAIKNARMTLDGIALRHGREVTPNIRVAGTNDNIYIDLGDSDWRCAHVTADGWTVISHPEDVYFIRPGDFGQLPMPVRAADPKATLDRLSEFVNLPIGDLRLFQGFLLSSLHPQGPYPHLCLTGEAGGGKTTTQRVAKAMTDPTKPPKNSPALVSLARRPKESGDLFVSAASSRVVTIDNISSISDELSDELCCLATGDAYKTRKYYTNFDEASMDACNPVLFNGIGNPVTRSDLGERSIVLETTKPAYVIEEVDFWRNFEGARPEILGALFTALSGVIKHRQVPNPRIRPRMVGFVIIGMAAGIALGWDEDFLGLYLENQRRIRESVAEAQPVVLAIVEFARKHGFYEGRPGKVLEDINLMPSAVTHAGKRGWPKDAKALKEALKRNQRVLEDEGVTFGESETNSRNIWIASRVQELRPEEEASASNF